MACYIHLWKGKNEQEGFVRQVTVNRALQMEYDKGKSEEVEGGVRRRQGEDTSRGRVEGNCREVEGARMNAENQGNG